jgi:hypothetical protein
MKSSLAAKIHSLQVGQIAKHCQVNPRTVHRWIKELKLKSFALPSGHFRVKKSDFRHFLLEHGFPLVSELFDFTRQQCLIVDGDEFRVEQIRELLQPGSDSLHLHEANTLMGASLLMGVYRPQLVFVSLEFEAEALKRFLQPFSKRGLLKQSLVMATVDSGSSSEVPKKLKQILKVLELPCPPKVFENIIKEYFYEF